MIEDQSLKFEDALAGVKQGIERLTSIPHSELGSDDVVEDILASDSLSEIELWIALEEVFAVVVSEPDMSKFRTLASIAHQMCDAVNRGRADGR